MKKILICIGFIICSVVSRGQSGFEGGLLISDDTHRDPVATALLELNSSTKGVLMPRMTYENMRAINSPADGLLVFVTSSIEHGVKSRGFYFYDEIIRKAWVKIEAQAEKAYQSEPVGTIVGFSGKLSQFFNADGSGKTGTDYDGWRVCNGMGGTPDLSTRFLVGASSSGHYIGRINEKMLNDVTVTSPDLDDVRTHSADYDIIGRASGDQSVIVLSPDNIPIHSHQPKQLTIVQVDHSHKLPTLMHMHSYERATGRKGDEKYPQEAKNNSSQAYMEVYETLPDIEMDGNVSLAYRSDMTLTIDFPQCHLEKFGSVNPTSISNEPKYYVLAFIIKTAPSPFVYQDELRNDITFEIYTAQGSSDPYSMTYYHNNAE